MNSQSERSQRLRPWAVGEGLKKKSPRDTWAHTSLWLRTKREYARCNSITTRGS